MPAVVSLYHFIEVSISTGIFGALCGLFVPKLLPQVNRTALFNQGPLSLKGLDWRAYTGQVLMQRHHIETAFSNA